MSDLAELESRVRALETQVEELRARNQRVEADKAWETSRTRVLTLVAITYLTTSLVFWLIDVPSALLNALIPTVGYYLSTQTLPVVRRWWIARQ